MPLNRLRSGSRLLSEEAIGLGWGVQRVVTAARHVKSHTKGVPSPHPPSVLTYR